MESKNKPCLVLQYNPTNDEVIGIELTTTYNYWEKEAFIDMNKRQLFPCKVDGIKYKDYSTWFNNIRMCPISDEILKKIESIKSSLNSLSHFTSAPGSSFGNSVYKINFPKVFYPGYD